MIKHTLSLAAAVLLFFGAARAAAQPAEAAVEPPAVSTAAAKAWNPALALVFLEGIVALHGWAAVESPGLYGGLITLSSPLAASGNIGETGAIAVMSGMIALGQYNFNYVSNKSDAKKRRFWVTVAGLHLVPLLGYGADCLAGGPSCRKKPAAKPAAAGWRLYALPAEGGAQLVAARRF